MLTMKCEKESLTVPSAECIVYLSNFSFLGLLSVRHKTLLKDLAVDVRYVILEFL